MGGFFTGWEGRRGLGRGGGRARNRNLCRYFFFAKSVRRWSREALKRNAIDFQEHTDKFYPNQVQLYPWRLHAFCLTFVVHSSAGKKYVMIYCARLLCKFFYVVSLRVDLIFQSGLDYNSELFSQEVQQHGDRSGASLFASCNYFQHWPAATASGA